MRRLGGRRRRWRCQLFHRTHFGHKLMEQLVIADIRVRCYACRWCPRRWMVITPVHRPGSPIWPRFGHKHLDDPPGMPYNTHC